MALKNILRILSLAVTLVASCHVQAQVDIPGPRFRPRGVESPENTRPFADPGVFNYDAQAFAPVDFSTNDELDGQSGFFLSYDRLATSISRSSGDNIQPNLRRQSGTNNLWGNRYNIGWYGDDERGWMVSYQQSEGNDFVNGQDILVANPMLVTNTAASVELNRIFRQETQSGGYFEPYLGLRYMYLSDKTLEDTTQAFGGTTFENRFTQSVSNSGTGLHAGGRYSQRRGRYRYSCDVAVATLYNEQRMRAGDIATDQTSGAVGITEIYFNDQSFVPVIDMNFDLAYNLSRDIAVRGGVQVMYMWDGLARANTLSTNFNPNSSFGFGGTDPLGFFEDGVLNAGFTLGVEWRR